MAFSPEDFNDPELQELWATAQERGSIFLGEVKERAKATGASLQEVLEWLESEGIIVVSEETDEFETFTTQQPVLSEEEDVVGKAIEDATEETPETGLGSSLRVLFRSLRYRESLSPKEEMALAQRAKEGDLSAREQLIEINIPVVLRIASEFSKLTAAPLEDLVQEGCIGLIKALDRYDWSRGVQLGTYAFWWIRQSIIRAVAEYTRLIHTPLYMIDALSQLMPAFQRLTRNLGREPTVEELASETGIPISRIEEALKIVPKPISLETPVDADEEMVLEDIVPDMKTLSPEDACWRSIARKHLRALLECLSEREREILKLRLGFVDGRPYTLKEISRILKITGEGVRHIEKKALAKLRRPRYQRLLQQLNELLS